MVRLAVILHNLFGGHLYEYLIRSPAFNRLATRTHAKVQQVKMRLSSSEEELQQLRENEKLLKEAEEKFKSIEGDSPGDSELGRFWKIFKEEFRNVKK